MIDYYEINVSKNNKHFFATHKRSLTNKSSMIECYNIFKEKFPAEEGYEITVKSFSQVIQTVEIRCAAQIDEIEMMKAGKHCSDI